MSESSTLDLNGPATIEAVVEAVIRLSAYDETQLLEIVSEGKLRDVFPFRPSDVEELPPDFVSEDELVEASAAPLDTESRKALIQSSMPRSKEAATGSPVRQAGSWFVGAAKLKDQIPD